MNSERWLVLESDWEWALFTVMWVIAVLAIIPIGLGIVVTLTSIDNVLSQDGVMAVTGVLMLAFFGCLLLIGSRYLWVVCRDYKKVSKNEE